MNQFDPLNNAIDTGGNADDELNLIEETPYYQRICFENTKK